MALDLPLLPAGQPLVDANAMPSLAFTVYWQRVIEQLEATSAAQAQQIADIQAALDAAIAAQTAAAAAQTTATDATRESARINSYTVPTIVLSASDAGTDASITVAAHVRVYPVQGSIDVPDVSILAGSITSLAFSTLYYVYYDDATLADTTPLFLTTTNPTTAQVGSGTGRHFVGKVTTPADGGTATTGGGGSSPPGGGGGDGLTSYE